MERLDKEGRLYFPKSPDGRIQLKRFLDEMAGNPLNNLWDDIQPIGAQAQERLGYPTQKPLALLERILAVSSNEGDVVLDPFCGCGTTVHAAQKLNRRWIGIDITHLSIALIRRRLIDAFPQAQFEIHGVPKDVDGARALAESDKHQFQLWALSMIEAQPYKSGQKGADRGVDGYLYFKPDGKVTEKAIVSIKGGEHVSDTMVKDLITTVEHEGAKMGSLRDSRATHAADEDAGSDRGLLRDGIRAVSENPNPYHRGFVRRPAPAHAVDRLISVQEGQTRANREARQTRSIGPAKSRRTAAGWRNGWKKCISAL